MSDQSMGNESHGTPETAKKKARSPVERVIVWGGIACLLAFTFWEAKQKYSYSPTLNRIKTALDSEGDPVTLSKFRKLISGSPSEQSFPDPTSPRNRKIEFKWPSFVKDYRIEITVANDEDDPLVEEFSTPVGADEEEVAK